MEGTEPGLVLSEFGNLLREERLRYGYTVDEIASRLKITSRMVRAIEEGDMESMPHAVYARGFIRAYAQLLGIGEEEVQPVYAVLRGVNEEPVQESISIPKRPAKRFGGGILIFLLVCGFLTGAGWYFRDFLSFQALDNLWNKTAGQAPIRPSEPHFAEPLTEETPLVEPAPISGHGNATTPISLTPIPEALSSSNATTRETTQLPLLSQNQATEATPVASNFSAPAAETILANDTLVLQNGSDKPTTITRGTAGHKHQIILTAQAECWVHSTADGTDTRQLSIRKGEVFALSFDRKLVVKLGNAGGVRIKYDGKDLPSPGKMGQVKTLTFPQDAQE